MTKSKIPIPSEIGAFSVVVVKSKSLFFNADIININACVSQNYGNQNGKKKKEKEKKIHKSRSN